MTSSDQLQINYWDNFFDDGLHQRLYPSWWEDRTANNLSHRRFFEPVLGILQALVRARGNYLCSISRWKVQKLALGLKSPGYACRNMQDCYIPDSEFLRADERHQWFQAMTKAVCEQEPRCVQPQEKWNYLMTIFCTEAKPLRDPGRPERLDAHGWVAETTDGNPHLESAQRAHRGRQMLPDQVHQRSQFHEKLLQPQQEK